MSLRPRKRLTQYSGHRLETGPEVEPVSLSDLAVQLGSPPAEDSNFIEECIVNARSMFEAYTGISCINQSWKMTLDRWPGQPEDDWWDGERTMPVSELQRGGKDYVVFPRYPLVSVDTVRTFDLGNNATSVTIANSFYTDTNSFPGRLILNASAVWPIALRDRSAIELVYTSGFGTNASAVPASIKRAIKQIAAFLYENRGSGCTHEFVLSKTGALQIASEYIVPRL